MAWLALLTICLPSGAWAGQPETPTAKADGSPIVKLPLDFVEPPRGVAAAGGNWRYRAHRDDRCAECERGVADATRRWQTSANQGVLACGRHAIVCYKEIDSANLDKICSIICDGNVSYSTDRTSLIIVDTLDVERLYHKDGGWGTNLNSGLMTSGSSSVSDRNFVPVSGPEWASYLPRGRASEIEEVSEYRHAVYCRRSYRE